MNIYLLDFIPFFILISLTIVALTLIIVISKTIRAQSIDKNSFERLAHELKLDNDELKSELATIKETLHSINKMMKEID